MMDKIIQFSIDNRLMVTLAALAFACAGGYVCTTVPVDVFPDLTAPTVVVLTEAAGMVPAEVENLATFPLETALNGAPGVRRVRSASMPGFSVVWAEFDWGAGMNEARQVVAERVAAAAADLPPEVSRPVLAPPSSIMGEIQLVALQSETHNRAALRDHADTVLRRRLQAVPGVAQVGVVGGDVRQFQAVADPARLAALDMTLGEVAEALRSENRNAAAGVIPGGGVEYQVTGLGRVRGVEDIAGVVAGVRGGVPVRVGDVAEVREGAEPVRGDGSANGRPAVLMYIQRQPDANTLALDGLLRVVLAEESARLPEGMTLDTSLFRQADFIRTAVRNVAVALRDGSLLVALIMVAFLANARALLVTLVALPLSMIAAVLVIHRTGGTLNTMTLGGLAVAVGSLVDDAVIDVENIVRRLRENGARPPAERLSALRVVYLASAEVRAPIVFATCIIAVVFLPVYTLSGVEGRLLRPLSTAYIVSVFASLAVAIVLTPALSAWLLPGARSAREGREPRLAGWVRRGYTALLRPTMNRPWLVCAPAALLTAGACALLPLMGRSFLPEFNEGALNVVMSTLPGTSLEESSRLALLAEKTLLAQPGVVSVARKTGRGELDEHAQGAEGSEFEATFVLPEGMGKEALLSSLRRDLSKIPGAVFGMGGPISHRIDHILSGARAAIAVKISGPDLHTLRNLASRVRAAMEAVPGVADLAVEPQADVPLVEVKFRRDALARNGVAFSEAETALRAAVHGAEVSRVHEGANTYGLAVRLDTPAARDPAALAALPLRSSGGATVPLGDVADIVRATGPNIITRDQVQRKIFITCNTAGRDVASLAAEIRERVDPLLAGAPGYTVSYGGQFESAARASRMLLLAGAATLAGVFLLLCAAFRSVRDALFVLLGLPLAVVGGVAGVYATGGVLSLASIIGFISVFGVAARNGIMLIRHIRHLQEEEGVADFREAVLRGAGERVVPILMTALSTGLALVPLALHGDLPGNELQTPMAVVILSGLFSATLLNLAVAPALYARFGRPARRRGSLTMKPLFILLCMAAALPAAAMDGPELSLEDAFRMVAAGHPAAAAAGLAVEEARGMAVQAGLPPNPAVELGVEGAGGGDDQTLLSLSQTVPLSGARTAARRAAQSGVEAAGHEADAARARLRAGTARAFFAVVRAQELLALAEESRAGAAELAALAEGRVARGDLPEVERLRAASGLELAEARLELARGTLAAARESLAAMAGSGAPSFGRCAGALAPPAPPPREELLARLGTRPGELARGARLRQAELEGRRAAREALPNPELRAGLRRFNATDESALDVGVGLEIPLFNRNQGAVAAARAAARRTEAESNAARRDERARAASLHALLIASLTAVEKLEKNALPRLDGVGEVARKALELGSGTMFEVLAARADALECRTALVEEKAAARAAAIDLDELAGT